MWAANTVVHRTGFKHNKRWCQMTRCFYYTVYLNNWDSTHPTKYLKTTIWTARASTRLLHDKIPTNQTNYKLHSSLCKIHAFVHKETGDFFSPFIAALLKAPALERISTHAKLRISESKYPLAILQFPNQHSCDYVVHSFSTSQF